MEKQQTQVKVTEKHIMVASSKIQYFEAIMNKLGNMIKSNGTSNFKFLVIAIFYIP